MKRILFSLYVTTCGTSHIQAAQQTMIQSAAQQQDQKPSQEEIKEFLGAAYDRNYQRVFELIQKYGNNIINEQTAEKDPILIVAVDYQWPQEYLERLLKMPGIDKNIESAALTPLTNAIANADFKNMRLLIGYGASFNLPNENGYTPLIYAAYKNQPEAVSFLLEAGASLDGVITNGANKGKTFFDFAQEHPDIQKVFEQFEKDHPEIRQKKQKESYDAMLYAIATADYKTLKKILSGPYKPDINAFYDHTTTPLMQAILRGDPNIVELLINSGANINGSQDKISNGTPLLFAVTGSATRTGLIYISDSIIKLLLAHGANINDRNKYGETALGRAVEKRLPLEIIKLLIQHGAPLNSQDNLGYTPLMHAVYYANIDIIEELLATGADESIRNKDGKTAIDFAKPENKAVVIKAIHTGKQISLLNQKLLQAAQIGDSLAINALLRSEIKPQIDAYDSMGRTALMIAAAQLHVDTVSILIQFGADIKHTDNQGYTALMEVLSRRHLEPEKRTDQLLIVQRLLGMRTMCIQERAEMINNQTKTGITALLLAISNHNKEAVKILIQPDICHGANVSLQNKDGITPLMLAAQEGDADMVRILLRAGAGVTTQDKAGKTAQDYAGNNLEILNLIAPSEKTAAALQEMRMPIRALMHGQVVEL